MKFHYYFLALLTGFALQAFAREKPAPAGPAAAVPALGQKAPGFTVPAFPGGKARLGDFQGKWLALCFYPKANAPKDIVQMSSLREAWPGLQGINAAILGISMDPPGVVEKFQSEQNLPFQLGCDTSKNVSAAYGALGLGGLFSTRRAVIINPQGLVVDVVDRCPEKHYGARLIEKIKALQAAETAQPAGP